MCLKTYKAGANISLNFPYCGDNLLCICMLLQMKNTEHLLFIAGVVVAVVLYLNRMVLQQRRRYLRPRHQCDSVEISQKLETFSTRIALSYLQAFFHKV